MHSSRQSPPLRRRTTQGLQQAAQIQQVPKRACTCEPQRSQPQGEEQAEKRQKHHRGVQHNRRVSHAKHGPWHPGGSSNGRPRRSLPDAPPKVPKTYLLPAICFTLAQMAAQPLSFPGVPGPMATAAKDCCTAKHSHKHNRPASSGVTQSKMKEMERTCINTCTSPRPSSEPACQTHLVPPQTWPPNSRGQGTPPTCPKMTLHGAPIQSMERQARFPPMTTAHVATYLTSAPAPGTEAANSAMRGRTGASAARCVARRQRVQTSGTCGGSAISSAATTNGAEVQTSVMLYS